MQILCAPWDGGGTNGKDPTLGGGGAKQNRFQGILSGSATLLLPNMYELIAPEHHWVSFVVADEWASAFSRSLPIVTAFFIFNYLQSGFGLQIHWWPPKVSLNPGWGARRKWPRIRTNSNARGVFPDRNCRVWGMVRAHNSLIRVDFGQGMVWLAILKRIVYCENH